MAVEIKLPRLGQGMESGTIVKWLKSEGDEVQKGEPLYELDTEKVTQEVEADAGGVLLKIVVSEGEVEVGRTIAFVGEAGEQVAEGDGAAQPAAERAEPEPAGDGAEASAEKPAEAPAREPERERGRVAAAAEAEQVEAAPTRADGRVKASPLARRIARERGIDLAALSGTGPEGRIVAEDVERAAAAPTPATAPAAAEPPPEVEEIELTSTRKTIARRLTEAWQAPVFQLTITVDMTRALALHERLHALRRDDEPKATLSDVLTRVTAAALLRHRELNAHFVDGRIRRFGSADVGIAVAAPSGLVVPVLRACERKSVMQIAAERAEVVGRAREGKLRREDLDGGTFTISNLGMYGIEQFIAVLNPPQVAILAVGAVEERPVVEDGMLEARPALTLTLTCDHRAVDGAAGAEFLRTLTTFLEEPGLAL